jgi:hypothetical protein
MRYSRTDEDRQFLFALKTAEVIVAVDIVSGEEYVVYGHMARQNPPSVTFNVAIDARRGELEELLEIVSVLRCSHKGNRRQNQLPGDRNLN